THVLIWFIDNPKLLSTKARREINRAFSLQQIYFSQISYWEIAMLVAKGRLVFNIQLKEWLESVERLPQCSSVGITPSIAAISYDLSDTFHGDPADRIIVATSIALNIPLITKDKVIGNHKKIKTIW
ncbi:MAG: type II toxin-antitoxin system VapC family toxin, partial [Deltaproteobacteria bacterium]|nr:type II toxin-antitoxin system VapC family toxin [Deltaproteobacteria bacterium]